jgi:hypothetical protein
LDTLHSDDRRAAAAFSRAGRLIPMFDAISGRSQIMFSDGFREDSGPGVTDSDSASHLTQNSPSGRVWGEAAVILVILQQTPLETSMDSPEPSQTSRTSPEPVRTSPAYRRAGRLIFMIFLSVTSQKNLKGNVISCWANLKNIRIFCSWTIHLICAWIQPWRPQTKRIGVVIHSGETLGDPHWLLFTPITGGPKRVAGEQEA